MRIRMLVEECVCDANALESGSQDEGLIQELTRMVEPHAQRAVRNCERRGYTPRWANAVAAGKKALATNSRASAALSLFAGRVMAGMDR